MKPTRFFRPVGACDAPAENFGDTAPVADGAGSSARSALRRGDVFAYVSPSRLNLWLKCPLAFRLKYIDGVPLPTSPGQFVGKAVHSALEYHYKHRQMRVVLEREQVVQRVSERWEAQASSENVVFADTEEESACRQQATGLVRAYLEQVQDDEPLPLAVETNLSAPLTDPFTGESLGLPLVGILDLVLDDPAGPLVVDFKTAARGGEVLELTHELQLSAYSLLLRHNALRPESGVEIRSLIKTKLPRVEVHRFEPRSRHHYERFFAVVGAYLDDLYRGRFIMRPNLLCSSCEFHQRQCRAWDGS